MGDIIGIGIIIIIFASIMPVIEFIVNREMRKPVIVYYFSYVFVVVLIICLIYFFY